MIKNSNGHSQASIGLAEFFTGENYDTSTRKIPMPLGPKTVRGVADIIEAETRTGDLIEPALELLSIVEHELEHDPEPDDLPSWARAVNKANKVVAEVLGNDWT